MSFSCFKHFSTSIFLTYLSLSFVNAQVVLRDTTVRWQHHQFTLNDDHSMQSHSTVDTDIEQVEFTGAKVIENELIRLVVIPEYGGRVISFFHKPSQHEFLYQSECGSAYGIGEGNFYYNWLMVYGGIFPTLTEPEHGKSWLLPWDFSVIKNNADTVTVRMEYTDNTSYSGAPGQFNNGITNITCQVDISVYSASTIWDFDVSLINNNANNQKYEYWTCTTMTPGSEAGDTGSPLNSEIIVPVDNYFAAWSPNAWIGSSNSTYSMSKINYLSEWTDMGIAYASNLADIYWGVINHENEEGLFRVSENIETKGMKMWTWGKNNIDNNMFDFSNGGQDNYIELWAGTSNSFFTDATLAASEEKKWKESYCATIGLSNITEMNNEAAINLIWEEKELLLSYELNTFLAKETYTLEIEFEGEQNYAIENKTIQFEALGLSSSISVDELLIPSGTYLARATLYNGNGTPALVATKEVVVPSPIAGISNNDNPARADIISLFNNNVRFKMTKSDNYELTVFNLNGQLISSTNFRSSEIDIHLPSSGLYLAVISNHDGMIRQKFIAR